MAVDAGDLIQLKVFCKNAPQIGINIRHFLVNAVQAPNPTYQQFADAWSLDLALLYKPAIGSFASYFGISLQRFAGGIWIPEATSTTGQGMGSGAGDLLPSQVAGIVRLLTGLPGRANRGRMYIPFPTEGANDSVTGFAIPTAAYQTLLNAIGQEMVNPVVTQVAPAVNVGMVGQVYHRAAGTFTPVTSRNVPLRWATQRRRGSFGAPNADPF